MAIVTGPLHSSEARGKVGSLVYNTYRGRSYVKSNVAPSTQYSADQIAARAVMVPVIAEWQSMTDAQRDSWNAFASEHTLSDWTGQAKRLSGWNWFAKINYYASVFGGFPTTTPLADLPSLCVTMTSSQTDPLEITLTWCTIPYPSGGLWFLMFRLAGPHSAARHPSIRMADFTEAAMAEDLSYVMTVPSVGWYTIYATPVLDAGWHMPPQMTRCEVV